MAFTDNETKIPALRGTALFTQFNVIWRLWCALSLPSDFASPQFFTARILHYFIRLNYFPGRLIVLRGTISVRMYKYYHATSPNSSSGDLNVF